MAEKQYHRLTRSRSRRDTFVRAFSSRSSLWLGKDHLLCVDVEGFTERYRRFYFRDLQLITMRTTRRRAIWNGVLILFLVLFLLEVFLDGPGFFSVTFAVILAFFLTLNNLMGTACRVYFQTAVQTEEIPSLSRVGRTHKVLARIRPLIAAAQGQLSPEEATARITELNSVQRGAATSPLNIS